MPQRLLATMITTTSYGTWLPGDLRGFVENGIVLPPDPILLEHAAKLLSADPVYFSQSQQERLFDALVSAAQEFQYNLICVSVERWHLHWLIDHGFDEVEDMVGRLKTRMRQTLQQGRIWTEGYDKRFCFTDREVENRHAYIMRHRGYRSMPTARAPLAPGSTGGQS